MNDKELRKLIQEKREELCRIQRQYDQNKYEKQLEQFTETFSKDGHILSIIKEKDLNPDDCRILALRIAEHIVPIYRNFDAEIQANQEKRGRKNAARKARRKQPAINERSIQTQENPTSTPHPAPPLTERQY